jgi:hypothetical protein
MASDHAARACHRPHPPRMTQQPFPTGTVGDMSRSLAVVTAVMVTALVGVGLAACSAEPDAGSAAATTSGDDVCGAADDLRESLAALRDVPVVQEGTAARADAWPASQDDWARFADAAGAEYGDEVDDVQVEADAVGDAVDAAQDATSAATLGAAATAVGAFFQGADSLVTETSATC